MLMRDNELASQREEEYATRTAELVGWDDVMMVKHDDGQT